jgi:WD40 repeat protein
LGESADLSRFFRWPSGDGAGGTAYDPDDPWGGKRSLRHRFRKGRLEAKEVRLPVDTEQLLASADGKRLIAISRSALRILDPQTYTARRSVYFRAAVRSVGVTADLGAWYFLEEVGTVLVADGPDGRARVLDVPPDHGTPRRIAVSPDGSRLALGAESGAVWLMDPGTGKAVARRSKGQLAIDRLLFSPDSRVLAIVARGSPQIRLRRASDTTRLANLENLPGEILSVAFSPGGRYLAAGIRIPSPSHCSRLATQ